MEVESKKIDTIMKCPRPMISIDIPSFLGLANYYHKFVEGFSSIDVRLIALTKKKAKFE